MRLTESPAEVIPGMRAWRNQNGYTAVLLHHSADKDTASAEARRRSVPDEQAYKREHELDFTSYAGKPVYGGFDDSMVTDAIGFLPDLPVFVGLDFGYHHPAAVFAQIGGQVWILGEVMGEDMTLFEFLSNVFLPYRDKLFPDAKFVYAADPAGRQVSDKSEHTSFAILANHGIFPSARKTEINEGLTLLRQKIGTGTLLVHPRCRLTIEALKGGYRYPEATPSLPEPLLPAKDGFYEHLADALRYLAVNSMTLTPSRVKSRVEEESFVDKQIKPRRYHDPDFGELS